MARACFALLLFAFGVGLTVKVAQQRRVLGRSPVVLGAAGEGPLLDWWDRVAPVGLVFWPLLWLWIAIGGAPLANGVRLVAALVLTLVGGAFTLASIFLMGRAWRIGIDPENRSELAEEGPYRWIRHPIYSGMLLVLLGTALAVPGPGVTVAAVLTALGFVFQTHREEQHLRRTFGDRYAHYVARTGRFAPRIVRRR